MRKNQKSKIKGLSLKEMKFNRLVSGVMGVALLVLATTTLFHLGKQNHYFAGGLIFFSVSVVGLLFLFRWAMLDEKIVNRRLAISRNRARRKINKARQELNKHDKFIA